MEWGERYYRTGGFNILSVVVFHPSVAPFVQQAARALYEKDLLERFYTTLFDNPESGSQKVLCALTRLGGFDLATQLKRRAITEIPLSHVTGSAGGEILRLLSGRVDKSGRLTDSVWNWSETSFDRKVSAQLRPPIRGVYGYENSSQHTFERAGDLGMRVFYDLPAPEAQFFLNIQKQELEAFPELQTSYQKHTEAREEERMARRSAEWNAADLIVVNSEFTRRSFLQANFPKKEIAVIPYGAPPPIAPLSIRTTENQKLQLLWAGTFSIRKGAHYLLKAWRDNHLGRHATLRIHGAVTLPESILKPLPEGVAIAGSIPRSELFTAYQKADALIFPTLFDGFGMVVTEAFACALPVIATTSAGAADLIRDRENGLLIAPGDTEAIASSIQWCLDNRAALSAMRPNALASARSWQWEDYRAKLASEVRRVLS